ncbi:hypothetical protein LPUS_02567 [Lasallia pustulata]|uniref:Uncharacterized protein n=1 Tax=Lasallia pustulata TaxID=136370 RepID=A0A1W5CT25_9LECA|nr:hypothetical protein LPUS_02567 [Lasallia pustulata]
MALGLWVEDVGISREKYLSLLEILNLVKDVSQLQKVPRSLAIIKRNVKASLPLFKMRRKSIPVNSQQMPTLPNASKKLAPHPLTTWMYWFDPLNLFTTILSSPDFTSKMHFGMAHLVDQPSELWHSTSWASSIRSTSGEFAYYKDETLIFPSDVVYYHCLSGCGCQNGDKPPHIGRIYSIAKDYTTAALVPGCVVFHIQQLLYSTEIPPRLARKLPEELRAKELLCVKDDLQILSKDHLLS